jgi:hypothetical protein
MTATNMASRSAFVAALTLILGPVRARAEQPPMRAPTVQAVIDCRKLEDPGQRLACYDKTVAAMTDAEAKGDLVSIDRAQRREARRQAFGFALPSLSFLERGDRPDEFNHIDDTIASAYQNGEGRWVFRMQSGSVWRQTQDEETFRKPHEGSSARISKASLGSFMMSVDGQPGIRVHRDN